MIESAIWTMVGGCWLGIVLHCVPTVLAGSYAAVMWCIETLERRFMNDDDLPIEEEHMRTIAAEQQND